VDTIGSTNHDISFNNSNLLDVSFIQINNDVSCSSLLVDTIGFENQDISFNNSNLLDVSFIQVNNDMSCSSLTVDTIGFENHDISFNNSNLLDVSFIQVNNDVSCSSLTVDTISSNSDTININKNVIIDGSLVIQNGDVTLIHTKDLDISDNIIGLNRGNTSGMDKNTSGMLINYGDASNIFFGYHKGENAFVIADTSYNHDDVSRNIVVDKYVDLKVGNIKSIYDNKNYVYTDVYSNRSYIRFESYSNSATRTGQIGLPSSSDALHIMSSDGIWIGSQGNNISVTSNKTIFYDSIEISGNINVLNGNIFVPDGTVSALSFNATSDYRTKTNIKELDENITVSNLRPLVYLKNGKKEIGLLAHELQEVYPFMVCGEKDGKEMQSVNYNGLIGVLINDVKRLTNENQMLKSNSDTLKSRLDTLEEKINKTFE